MKFSWNPAKDQQNISKHGISFQEATTAFGDPLAGTIPDPDHSVGEQRFLTIGRTSNGRLIVVSHMEDNDSVRIINARDTTAHERKTYES